MAQSNLQKNIQSAKLSSGEFSYFPAPNTPTQYGDRQKTYFNKNSAIFRYKKLKYASDFVKARAEGLFPDAPKEWTDCRIRLSDVVRPSSAIQRDFDDYKMIVMEYPKIEYVPQGTKFDTMGSIWLMWNPMNLSATDGAGVLRKCKATWNHLDFYGNVLEEPIIVDNTIAQDSSGKYREFVNEAQGYFTITCQRNEQTEQLNNNSRLILGSSAYRITGFTDFLEEFTGDYDTVRLVRFTARYEEPNDRIDDMANHVAGGKEFSWEIQLSGTPTLYVGNSGKVTATSIRNGNVVENTVENPVTYTWESSDDAICAVDDDGNIVATGAGNAIITATLNENPAHTASITVTVEEALDSKAVLFKGTIPDRLKAYESVEVSAAYYEQGIEMDVPVIFSFTGARRGSYSAAVNNNTATITCYGGSITPLTVAARYGSYETTAEIQLIGL